MALSPQQEAVVNFAIVAGGHLVVRALAGCGKSFTLVEVVKAAVVKDPSAEIVVVAYNKAIAAEMQAKLSKLNNKNVRAQTMHAAGFSALRSWLQRMKNVQVQDPSDKKIAQIVADLQIECVNASITPGRSQAQVKELQEKAQICETQSGFVVKAVSLAKQRAFGVAGCPNIDDDAAWMELFEHFGLMEDLDEAFDYTDGMEPTTMNPKMQSLLNLCKVALKRSNEQTLKGIIDFDDMVYQPLFYRAKFWPKTFVLVDEVQDLNLSRRLLAMRMAGTTGRIIAVGDHNQAVYGFTGADSDSMDQLKASLSAHELPLTMTYRCPKAVVREAQRWVPDFQAHDSNPEGVVRSIPFLAQVDSEGNKLSPDFQDEQLTKEDAILCRNTKPLVELAYNLIRRGIACRVEGREIGQGLITMARRWKVVRLDAFKNKVQSWRDREVTKYQAKGKEDMIQGVEDKADTIICLIDALMAEGKTTVAEFETFVTNLFGDTKDGEVAKVLTLCTGHRSKGREWKRVYWLFPELSPSKYAKKDWQLQQERNLQYVIVTRSMHELVYVDVE